MENTSEYIIETIAPIFNKNGYIGTSLSDLTKATGLTKGALYCNFLNKEELALKSFQYNVKKALAPLYDDLSKQRTSLGRLGAITNYYRNYYDIVHGRGGCPILNVGIDAKYNCPSLYEAAKNEASRLMTGLANIIRFGIENSEIRKEIDADQYAQKFYSMIEGAVFMSLLYEDRSFLTIIVDTMDGMIDHELKKE